MKLNKVKLPDDVDVFDPLDMSEDLTAEIAKQKHLVVALSDAKYSSGERGNAMFKLARLYYENGDLTLAQECAVQAMALRKLFYGKDSNEFVQAVTLTKIIFDEIAKTLPPPRRRRKNVKKASEAGETK